MEQKFKKEETGNNIAKSVNIRSSKSKKKKRKNSTIAILCFVLGVVTGIVMGVMIAVLILDKEESTKNVNNVIVETENHKEENDFSENISDDEEGFLIETPIVNLYYPKRWENQVHVETLEGEICIVQFFAAFEGKGKVQLFDIAFGGEEGYTLGYFEDKKNEKIAINIISYDFELGQDWTSEEKDSIYTMMEDVNFIINRLENESGIELIQ